MLASFTDHATFRADLGYVNPRKNRPHSPRQRVAASI
jgi:hypothetical protein